MDYTYIYTYILTYNAYLMRKVQAVYLMHGMDDA